jgi:ribosomal protein S18 acetylase RimI-like enzyme
MNEGDVLIRSLEARDEAAWRRLWAEYLVFYKSTLPDAVTSATWTKLIGDDNVFLGTVAEVDGQVVGIANSILHPTTWSLNQFCYLNDLYVDPMIRGRGIGKLLIDDLIAKAQANGWARLYWSTKEDNEVARRLYDRFGEADGFVRYAKRFE